MEKFHKLTVDEKGQLHGGFALHSLNDIGKTYLDNKNTNCSEETTGDLNTNCSCPSCGKDTRPPKPVNPTLP